MKYILISLGVLVFSFSIQAQTTPPINREIVNAQSRTAALFRLALENNNPDSALKFVDKKYLTKNPTLQQEIIKIATILYHIKFTCLPRYSDISYTDTATVFAVQYTIPPPRFTLWVSFDKGNKDSKITFINFRSQEQLEEEKTQHPSEPPVVVPPPPRR